MKGKTHSTEEIIRILRQADGGQTAQSVCREHNISEQTFYRWKKKYGDMNLLDAKRLKELEKENAELKKMLAESMLENRVLKEGIQKSGRPFAEKSRCCSCDEPATVLHAKGCHYLGLPRSTYRYGPKLLTDWQQQLHQGIETLSWAHPRYGYRRIRRLLTKGRLDDPSQAGTADPSVPRP